jgi:hypothetical protein
MDRRTFIKRVTLASLAICCAPVDTLLPTTEQIIESGSKRGYGGIPPASAKYYENQLLKRAQPSLLFSRLSEETHSPIKKTNTIKFRRYTDVKLGASL